MNVATYVQPAAGHGKGSVRTQNQPSRPSDVVVVPELLVLDELLFVDRRSLLHGEKGTRRRRESGLRPAAVRGGRYESQLRRVTARRARATIASARPATRQEQGRGAMGWRGAVPASTSAVIAPTRPEAAEELDVHARVKHQAASRELACGEALFAVRA